MLNNLPLMILRMLRLEMIPSSLVGLYLWIIEISGNCYNGIFDGFVQVLLSGFLHFGPDLKVKKMSKEWILVEVERLIECKSSYLLKVAFFQKVRCVFQKFQISKKIYSKKLSLTWNLNFKLRIVFWNIFFEIWRSEKNSLHFLKKSHP